MPSSRFIRKSRTFGKEPRRMAKSIIESITGNATAPEFESLIKPTANASQVGTTVVSEGDSKDTISPSPRIAAGFRLSFNDSPPEGRGLRPHLG